MWGSLIGAEPLEDWAESCEIGADLSAVWYAKTSLKNERFVGINQEFQIFRLWEKEKRWSKAIAFDKSDNVAANKRGISQ